MDEVWICMIREAKKVLKPRRVSEMMETAGVAAAIESVSGKIYVGVCVDGGCTLGICAERNAIFQMLTYGETQSAGWSRSTGTARYSRLAEPAGN